LGKRLVLGFHGGDWRARFWLDGEGEARRRRATAGLRAG
jgi:hypothetical protein